MSANGGVAAGLLLVLAGAWLLLQTLVGDLPARIVDLATGSTSSSSKSKSATSSSSPDSPQGNLNTNPAPNPGSTATPGTQPSAGYSPYVPPSYVGGEKRVPTSYYPAPAANLGNPSSPPAPYF